jgi:glycolate oxidase iron-sulfur subunit
MNPMESKAETFPLEEAERCVACGLCLPHCPTYRKTQNEADSPRGRIALMSGLAKGDLRITSRLESHLALCLACRACEAVCPSYVQYGKLLDAGRALIKNGRRAFRWGKTWRRVAYHSWLARPERLRSAGRFLRGYQRSGLQRLLRKTGLLKMLGLHDLDAELPPLPRLVNLEGVYRPRGNSRGRVALFTGCVARLADQETLQAAIRLLNRMGCEVLVPPGQNCCGALPLHNGEADAAAALMQRNIEAFPVEELDAIVTLASGCGAMLSEYPAQLPADRTAAAFSGKITDICQFLADREWPIDLTLLPLPKRIAVHDPCTLAHVLRRPDKPYALLRRIPGAEILPLPENNLCCGAAGTYHLTQPEMARKLRADKIGHLRRLAPDILTTSNIGCALYLAAGVREAGLNIEVLHPIVLLERQLGQGIMKMPRHRARVHAA